jgi:hypothetical protein
MALASLLKKDLSAAVARAVDPLAPHEPHFPGRAKHVIYLHLTGSPPHLDLFDYKPELVKRNGQDCPDEFLKGKRFAFTSGVRNCSERREFAHMARRRLDVRCHSEPAQGRG